VEEGVLRKEGEEIEEEEVDAEEEDY